MTKGKPTAQKVSTNIRLPADIREQLDDLAKINSRSLAGEILHRVKQTLAQDATNESRA